MNLNNTVILNKWIYLGKETHSFQNQPIDLDVWVKKKVKNNDTIYYFIKSDNNEDYSIDSIVSNDGTYTVMENNRKKGISITRNQTGYKSYIFSDTSGKTIKMFYIGLTKDEIYDEKGHLKPDLKEVREDTAFVDLEYYDKIQIPVEDLIEE